MCFFQWWLEGRHLVFLDRWYWKDHNMFKTCSKSNWTRSQGIKGLTRIAPPAQLCSMASWDWVLDARSQFLELDAGKPFCVADALSATVPARDLSYTLTFSYTLGKSTRLHCIFWEKHHEWAKSIVLGVLCCGLGEYMSGTLHVGTVIDF